MERKKVIKKQRRSKERLLGRVSLFIHQVDFYNSNPAKAKTQVNGV
jgi:hypothetical protein